MIMLPVRFPTLGTRDQRWVAGASLTNIVTIATLVDTNLHTNNVEQKTYLTRHHLDHGVETHWTLQNVCQG